MIASTMRLEPITMRFLVNAPSITFFSASPITTIGIVPMMMYHPICAEALCRANGSLREPTFSWRNALTISTR